MDDAKRIDETQTLRDHELGGLPIHEGELYKTDCTLCSSFSVMGTESRVSPTPDEATERLAAVLYEKMEHLDPTDGPETWEGLTEDDKHFYLMCVRAVLREKRLICSGLS